MSARHDIVNAQIELRLIAADGPNRAVTAELTFAPNDPYAVRVGFHTSPTEVVEWTFARSLLTDGVTHPVGDGDVQVWPVHNGDPMVCLSLSSPSGQALFEASLPELVQFLTQTYALVPTGCESDFVDLDAELGAILGDGF